MILVIAERDLGPANGRSAKQYMQISSTGLPAHGFLLHGCRVLEFGAADQMRMTSTRSRNVAPRTRPDRDVVARQRLGSDGDRSGPGVDRCTDPLKDQEDLFEQLQVSGHGSPGDLQVLFQCARRDELAGPGSEQSDEGAHLGDRRAAECDEGPVTGKWC